MFKPYLQSPLHHFDLPAKAKGQDTTCGVWANEMSELGYVVLRGDANDPGFIGGVNKVLGIVLPTRPCTFSRGDVGTLLWLSPDEWLLTCARTAVKELIDALESALAGLHTQVIDNSGGLTQVYLTGCEHVTLLRHVGVYDFESITPGKVVGTVCGKASIVAYRLDSQGLFVVLRRSFADYVWRLLERAGRPYGFGVCILPADKAHPVAAKSAPHAALLSV
jgi:sarcosine oxidase subunit gamma